MRIAAVLFATLAPLACLAGPAEARLGREAFLAIEADPFEGEALTGAAKRLETAMKTAPDEPWVLIARSRAQLEVGYLKGDRSKLSSYRADQVKLAGELARRAVEKGPGESMAHVQVARMQIVTEDFRGAWETLNTAYRLDPGGFYPWYYRGVIALRMNDVKRAGEAFDMAEKAAGLPYQKEWAVGRRIDIARKHDDAAGEERLHKQLIAMDPLSPHRVGNYAMYLKRQKRYDEAIEQFRKAIAIRPYPLAEEQLKQTLLLRDSKR